MLMSESEFVNSLHVNQRKTYWKLKLKAWAEGMTDAAKIVHSVDDPALELAIQHQRDAALSNVRLTDRC